MSDHTIQVVYHTVRGSASLTKKAPNGMGPHKWKKIYAVLRETAQAEDSKEYRELLKSRIFFPLSAVLLIYPAVGLIGIVLAFIDKSTNLALGAINTSIAIFAFEILIVACTVLVHKQFLKLRSNGTRWAERGARDLETLCEQISEQYAGITLQLEVDRPRVVLLHFLWGEAVQGEVLGASFVGAPSFGTMKKAKNSDKASMMHQNIGTRNSGAEGPDEALTLAIVPRVTGKWSDTTEEDGIELTRAFTQEVCI